MNDCSIVVSVEPGSTALTRMPCRALLRRRLRETDDAVLRCGVVREPGSCDHAGTRRGIDDRSRPGSRHGAVRASCRRTHC